MPITSFRSRGLAAVAFATALGLGAASCSSGTTTTTGASTTAAPTTVAAASTGGSTAKPSSSTSSASAAKQVNANTATVAELQAVFEANGVTNASKWAREVEEYRPYATDDPTFASLRKNLAKYNPAPDVLQKILASLSL